MTASRNDAARDLAPTGVIRAAINTGNPVLAKPGIDGAPPSGVTVDLSREIAARLARPVMLRPYAGAGAVFAALDDDAWDIAFLAIEPVRAARVNFSAPYVAIDGIYAVRQDAPFAASQDLDRDGRRIAVARNAAYDLYLTRTLSQASLVRFEGPAAAFDGFLSGPLDAVAGIRQAIDAFLAETAGLRAIADPFMTIEQAVVTLPGRAAGAAFIEDLMAELKSSGWLAEALRRHGQAGTRILGAT